MALSFPTLAEQCESQFRAATTTVALERVALALGAVRDGDVWVFPDDTRLRATGRGRSHRIETFYP